MLVETDLFLKENKVDWLERLKEQERQKETDNKSKEEHKDK